MLSSEHIHNKNNTRTWSKRWTQ